MFPKSSAFFVVSASVAALSAVAPGLAADSKRPTLSLRASPPVAFAPARVVLTVELKGGRDDYEAFYCPTVEWDWDDGTISQSTADCDPYAAGKSTIKRRYLIEHVFRYGGAYHVQFRLKRREKVIVSVATVVQVRPGIQGPP